MGIGTGSGIALSRSVGCGTLLRLVFSFAVLVNISQVAPADANPAAFTTLDRTALGTHYSGDLAFSFQEVPSGNFIGGGIDITSVRMDARAQWVNREGNLGAFLHVPVSLLIVNDDVPGFSNQFALANIEAAGLYIIRNRSFDLVFRGGIAFPTAGDSQGAYQANISASYSRLTDLALASPSTTWLRASGSILGGRPRGLYWRVDGGVDVALSSPNNFDPDPLLRLNAGVGYRLNKFALMGELATLVNSSLGPRDDDMTHTFAVTARFFQFKVVPSIGLVLPVDKTLRRSGFDFGITAGIRGRL